MKTRGEQIALLEEAFNVLVISLHKSATNDRNPSYENNHNYAAQLDAVTSALIYLRTVIPNPGGRIVPTVRPRRAFDLSDY